MVPKIVEFCRKKQEKTKKLDTKKNEEEFSAQKLKDFWALVVCRQKKTEL